ncbi:CDP-glycerol glycerophosphotransferase family protein [Paenibacillus sp. FSL K6-1566]|uniref:CDP-glycerol glycerophosphotransferase family protein n=1 Tax=Paenibacillus sp. FSL K6-1566 TaxID=2954515 RepID=UPI00310148A5
METTMKFRELRERIDQLIEEYRLEEAQKYIEKCKILFPNEAQLYMLESKVLIYKKETIKALDLLLEAVESHPTSFPILFNIAQLYDNLKLQTKALRYYKLSRKYCVDQTLLKDLNHKIIQIESNVDKPIIEIITRGYSGDNARALYNAVPEFAKRKYDIRLTEEMQFDEYENIYETDVVICTHTNYPFNRYQFTVELWHGFPLKGIFLMTNSYTRYMEEKQNIWNRVSIVTSYSPMFNTVFNACRGLSIRKYRITGAPRNDLLFLDGAREKLQSVLNVNLLNKKVVIYMPTFRKVYYSSEYSDGTKSWANLFGFERFNEESFNQFLHDENIILILKLHPYEEEVIMPSISNLPDERIHILSSQLLEENNCDLYELLGASDILMTDYSSVYFDYLLLDKPLIFINTDHKEYEDARGFLLTPYDDWTPGPKVTSQGQLEVALKEAIMNPGLYKSERDKIKRMAHTYTDPGSSLRVWELIDNEMGGTDEIRALFNEIENAANKNTYVPDHIYKSFSTLLEGGYVEEVKLAVNYLEEVKGRNSRTASITGIIHFMLNELQDAEKSLAEAMKLDPQNADIIYNLSCVYRKMNNLDKCEQYLKLAKQVTSDIELSSMIDQELIALQMN